MATEKKGLGRGLSALLGEDKEVSSAIAGTEIEKVNENTKDSSASSIKEVFLSELEISPLQPRVHFDEESLQGLVESIKEKGVLQPLLVRQKPDGKYEIIAGERRFRGSTEAGLEKVPVIVREFTDQEVLEVALIENLQRENLNAIEEAYGYKKLLEEFNHTQEELAKVVGKSRSHVANTMRLTGLSTEIKDLVVDGKLSAGHARALLSAKEPEKLAKKVISKNLSVRQTEKLASEKDEDTKQVEKSVKKVAKETQSTYQKDDDIVALEKELENQTGLKVTINFDGKGGELILFYDDLEQLDTVVQKLYNKEEYVGGAEIEMGIAPEFEADGFAVTFDEEESQTSEDAPQYEEGSTEVEQMDDVEFFEESVEMPTENISEGFDEVTESDDASIEYDENYNQDNIITEEMPAEVPELDVSINGEELMNDEISAVDEEVSGTVIEELPEEKQ